MADTDTPPIISATKTAVFQLRAPSAWKRAALLDTLKRTHLATGAVLQAILAELEVIQAITKKTERTNHMQRIAYATLTTWDLSGASAAAARVDASGMVESYLQQLRDGRETTGLPTVPALGEKAVEEQAKHYAETLDALGSTHATVAQEGLLRDAVNMLARPIRLRPLSLHGYRHFYRLLKHPETGRLYAWLNILSRKSRFTPSQGAANAQAALADGQMVDIASGELVSCKSPTWLLFPLEFGFGYHECDFVFAGLPAGGRLVFRPEGNRFELHAGFTFEAPAIDTGRRFIGVDRGIYNLAAWAVTDGDYPGFHRVPDEDPPPPGEGTGKSYTNGKAKGDGEGEAKPLPFKMLDDLKLSTAPFWLIDGYLVRSPMMMIYGPGGSGKTYLGVSVAIGMLLAQWFGRTTEAGSVLICSFERHDDSEDRLAALRDRHGMTGKGLPLTLVDMTGQCLDAAAEARIILTAKAIVALSAQPMRAILIDTLAAALGGREQTPGLQGELRDAGNRIAAATGAIVCWVQHEGKTSHNGPIGYLDLANSCSTWWRVEEREDGSRVVHVDKANRGAVHVPLFAFRLVPFTAGQDDNKKDIVLCDLEEVGLDRALASAPRQPFGKPHNNENKRAPGSGWLQKLMVTELRKLESRHPDGVAKDLLKSPFVMKVADRQKAKGGPALTAKALTRKFNQTLESMVHPTTGDPLIEQNEDGTLALGEPA